jgi:NAD+ diphosphatase
MQIAFAGSPLDRASHLRRDEDWLKARMDDPQSRYLAMWKLQALIKTGPEPSLAWANADIRESCDPQVGSIFLGLVGDVAHFAVDITPLEKPERELGLGGIASFTDVRAAAGRLPAGEAAILAQSRSLIDWHGSHRFCAKCGEATEISDGGNMRTCVECDAEHFPRVNPVVIMLVSHGDRCLLGRQRGWPSGMYSALAGFIEPGETIEEAVRREVMEEASIQVGDVRYLASQPWPFPSSLMIGCLAEASSEGITVDGHELDDARWFPRDQIQKAIAAGGGVDGFFVPPPMAIAHVLIRAWSES